MIFSKINDTPRHDYPLSYEKIYIYRMVRLRIYQFISVYVLDLAVWR